MTIAYHDKVDEDPGFDYKFVLRRLARLLPVHYLCLAWGALLFLLDDGIPPEFQGALLTLPFEAALISTWGFGSPLGAINPLTWTVSTMFFHYLMFGALCRRYVKPFSSDPEGLR